MNYYFEKTYIITLLGVASLKIIRKFIFKIIKRS